MLVVNDDGIAATGISVLAHAASDAGCDVTVVAPVRERSGASAAVDAGLDDDRLRVHPSTLAAPGGPDAPTAGMTRVVSVDGSPAFIVMTALRGAYGPVPDLVVSGVNHGPNTGTAVLHSGTVGAAFTAVVHGVPALAVSMRTPDPASVPRSPSAPATASDADVPDVEAATGAAGSTPLAEPATGEAASAAPLASPRAWQTARELSAQALGWMLENRDLPGVLNLNIPDVDDTPLRGVRAAPLAVAGAVQATADEDDGGYVRLGYSPPDHSDEPDSDAGLLESGWATLTVLRPPVAVDVDLSGAVRATGGAPEGV